MDICDGDAVHQEFIGFSPEVVFHLAAQIDVRTSMAEPARDAHTNVVGSLHVYGPRQDPKGDAGVIAILCDRALAGTAPTIFGDGRQTRDYVYVGDIVAANLAAAGTGELPHDVYNVGTGTEVDLLELVDAVRAAADLPADRFAPEFRPARPGEVRRSCLDVTRARRELGLAATTGLATGLRATLDWIRSGTPRG